MFTTLFKSTLRGSLLVCAGLLPWQAAQAVPSFARQTGEECIACHIGGFGPQLTPHGMQFKLSGYTDTDGKGTKVPLSAMLVQGFTNTSKDQTEDAQPHFGKNNNLSLQEVSMFIAGRFSDHVGAFVQITGNDFDRRFGMDNMDIRVADTRQLGDKDFTYGISLNNNPTVQDPFNTLNGWKFPYMSSELAPGPAASPIINGALEQQVLGATAYAFYDNSFYAELGGYQTLSRSLRNKINVGEDGNISGTAPYWRVAYFKNLKKQAFHFGAFGMQANVEPDFLSGPTDRYRDVGVDASYQYLGTREHIFTLNTSYIDERRTLNNSFAAGGASDRHGDLQRFDIAGSYHYLNTYGITLGAFDIRGNKDDLLYNTGEADSGSIKGSPNSRGYIVQADWTPWGKEDSWGAPWANLRLGLQYTGYTKFNGGTNNYDGLGRNAKDNNTLFAFAWVAF
ncbi:hypothetical protein [Methylovorus sp. MP688]|uniref:hypothetical protein n=1 Tax=Methylovorus sp. (strain MP688) TaxID=887061 RepID=UPI0001EC4C8D|nr:hypothetical protein [Methylovorus sp. MP688]ADQ85142.1 putative cytochrome c1 signal peptide protein [Methylovorus sp. MP688]